MTAPSSQEPLSNLQLELLKQVSLKKSCLILSVCWPAILWNVPYQVPLKYRHFRVLEKIDLPKILLMRLVNFEDWLRENSHL